MASLPDDVLAIASAHDMRRSPRGDPWRGSRAWRLGRVEQPAAWLRAGRAHTARVADPTFPAIDAMLSRPVILLRNPQVLVWNSDWAMAISGMAIVDTKTTAMNSAESVLRASVA